MAKNPFRSVGMRVLAAVLLLILGTSVSSDVRAIDPPDPLKGFSNSGCADLVVGVPFEDLGSSPGKPDAGGINVIYGERGTGLDYPGNHFWNLDTAGIGIGIEAEAYDTFGDALATGDFDGDGYSDLAVGIPDRTVNSEGRAGAVHVIYGDYTGLSIFGDAMWHQDVSGMDGAAEFDDRFGSALASGDFDGDGYDDLAIGVPGEHIGDPVIEDAGLVHVMYGSIAGLIATGDEMWTQDSQSGAQYIADEAEYYDNFGEILATGDFNGDGYDDLAIGSIKEDIGDDPEGVDAGGVNIIYGSSGGLHYDLNAFWSQDSFFFALSILDQAEGGDRFSKALTSGDFDGDGYDDLAIGVDDESKEEPVEIWGVGAVHVLYGTSTYGIWYSDQQFFWQDDLGNLSDSEQFDYFGLTLAAGDFDADGFDDLAIGAPSESIGSTADSGAVFITYGTSSGLSTSDVDLWDQASSGVEGDLEQSDHFGAALAVGSFNCDTYDDLAISADFDNDVSGVTKAGVVNILYSSQNGLSSANDQIWSQDSASGSNEIDETSEEEDYFGASLAAAPGWRSIYLPIVTKD